MIHRADDKDALRALFDGFDAPAKGTRAEVVLAPSPDFAYCRDVLLPDGRWSPVKDHVKIGVRALMANPYFGLLDEMGGMKTAQVIIAAQFMFLQGRINRVIVFTPADARPVWFDKDLGELNKHLFEGLPARVSEFHAKIRQWDHGNWSLYKDQLRWIVTNYEFIGRSKNRLRQLMNFTGPKTLLVLDESSAVRNYGTLQSKAVLQLRRGCGHVVLLNGTFISETPQDVMNQGNIMHPSILDCKYITTFRARYCVMVPNVTFPLISGYKNLDDIQRRFAPYVLRRLKKDWHDLPPVLPTVPREIKLTAPTWTRYKQMRDDMIVWLTETGASLASHAAVKANRLAQITSGFIGGVEEVLKQEELESGDLPAFMRDEEWVSDEQVAARRDVLSAVTAISSEKIDDLLEFYAEHLRADSSFKLLVRSCHRYEVERIIEAFIQKAHAFDLPIDHIAPLWGSQKRSDRERALRLLHPSTAPKGPGLVAMTYGTGSFAHNFTASHTSYNISHSYSLMKHLQSLARQDRPGQVHAVSNFDAIAIGPTGQKTVDHSIIKARETKANIARWTTDAWLDALQEE